jgi:hypothetical protein
MVSVELQRATAGRDEPLTSAWRGAAFDCRKLDRCYWNIGFARLSACRQAAPANVS